MALTLTTATKDITLGSNETELETWIDGLTITHVYGFTCVPLSNSRLRYTIVYD